MQQPPANPGVTMVDRIIMAIYSADYRRMMWWGFMLTLRLRLLSLMVDLVGLVPTPGMMMLLRRWHDDLQSDVAEFKREVRAPQSRLVLQSASVMQPKAPVETANATGYENPWL